MIMGEKKGYAVLIVEDHRLDSDRIERAIRSSRDFYVTSAFRTAEEALSYIEVNTPDIILLDLDLPGMHGIEFIEKIRQKPECDGIRIVVLSVFEDEEFIIQSIRNGANGYLLKDLSDELLIAELQVTIHGGSAMSPRIAERIYAEIDSSRDKDRPENPLSKRENQVINLIALGFTYQEIADELNLSAHTIRRHIESIYRKLKVNSKGQAIRKGWQKGFIQPELE